MREILYSKIEYNSTSMISNINIANNNTLPNYLENGLSETPGWCLDAEGNDQNTGTITLPQHSSQGECLAECRSHVDATACEYYAGGGQCAYHTMDVAVGSGHADYSCWIIKSGTIKMKHDYQYSAIRELVE